MSDLLPPVQSAEERARPPPSRRRDKPQLSCGLCRRRKLKCDRKHPCSACSGRGLALSCSYPRNIHSPSQGEASRSSHPRGSVQDRIIQLENLVASLASKGPAEDAQHATAAITSHTPESLISSDHNETVATTPSDYGSMMTCKSGTKYVGNTHWAAVLDGIAELKDHFEREDEPPLANPIHDPTPQPSVAVPHLLYGCSKQASKEEILASLPSRPIVDRFVFRYFNTMDMSGALIHRCQFQKEYEEFWKDPQAAPIMWIGLLFSILSLSAFFQIALSGPRDGASPPLDLHAMSMEFRERVAQCLVIGRYLETCPFVLETLLHYFIHDYFRKLDPDMSNWMLIGTIVRLAMRMGYHRDPQHFPSISPAAGEMRRRTWWAIVQLDIATSIQMGMPRIIKETEMDTEEPRNLLDTDFDENTTELPPSRPETEPTPILYMRTKARITAMLAAVSDLTMDTRPCGFEQTMEADQRLQAVHAAIPSSFQWRSLSQCVTDTPQVTIQRLYMEIVCLTARIVLHRKFMTASPAQEQHAYSRHTCVEAAQKILELQQLMNEEIEPGGQLFDVRWKVSSVVNNHFLFATSILCLYTRYRGRGAVEQDSSANAAEQASFQKSMQLLTQAYSIWDRLSETSREARKTAKALQVVFQSLEVGPAEDEGTPVGSDTVHLRGVAESGNGSFAHQDLFPNFSVQFPIFDPFMGDQQWDLPGTTSTTLVSSSGGFEPWMGLL